MDFLVPDNKIIKKFRYTEDISPNEFKFLKFYIKEGKRTWIYELLPILAKK